MEVTVQVNMSKKISKIVCKKCGENLMNNNASSVTHKDASDMMDVHDRVMHQQEYMIEFVDY